MEILSDSQKFNNFFGDEPVLSGSIRVTKKCNLNCKHCYANAGQPLDNELKIDELKDVISQFSGLGSMAIFFTGGEPFLRNDMAEILKYTNKQKMSNYISTNAPPSLTENVLKEIDNINFKLFQFSLDSYKSDLHDKIRRKKGVFESTVEKIKMTKEHLKGNIGICSVLMKDNCENFGNIIELTSDLGVDIFALMLLIPYGRASEKIDPTPLEKKMALKSMFDTYNKVKEDGLNIACNTTLPPALIPEEYRDEYLYDFGFCSFPNIMGIESNGDVAPCDGFFGQKEMILGNVREQSLEEIWNSEKMKKLRNVGPEDLKGVCSKCKYKEFCVGGCRAMAYIKYKDIKAPDPVCQSFYDVGLFPDSCLCD